MRAKRPGQSPLLLLDVIDVLRHEAVDYGIIGALAAAVYGTIRASMDADALVSLSVAKLSNLSQLFRKKGLTTELRRGDADDPIPAMLRAAYLLTVVLLEAALAVQQAARRRRSSSAR